MTFKNIPLMLHWKETLLCKQKISCENTRTTKAVEIKNLRRDHRILKAKSGWCGSYTCDKGLLPRHQRAVSLKLLADFQRKLNLFQRIRDLIKGKNETRVEPNKKCRHSLGILRQSSKLTVILKLVGRPSPAARMVKAVHHCGLFITAAAENESQEV